MKMAQKRLKQIWFYLLVVSKAIVAIVENVDIKFKIVELQVEELMAVAMAIMEVVVVAMVVMPTMEDVETEVVSMAKSIQAETQERSSMAA
jgi:uncharacterized membrane protein